MMRFIHLIFGFLIWALFAAAWIPAPLGPRWIVVLLLFSPLVLMPLARPLWARAVIRRHRDIFEVPAAALLAPAFAYPPGLLAALAALPWLVFRSAEAFDALADCRHEPPRDIGRLCLHASRVFPAFGAAWLLADRLGWQPWGFDALIVLLTATHFHHAGFTLPLLAGLMAQGNNHWLPRLAGGLILAGVPLVAVAITLTRIAGRNEVEPWAVSLLVGGALIAAVLQIARAFDPEWRLWARTGAAFSGVCLVAAMVLALDYGWRYFWPSIAIPMPFMWAIHGSLNAFGFGLVGIAAWTAKKRARSNP